ncbi:MAG: DUF1572 family protein [Acidobacteria bacterium]|nr:DUF1572 family protein [Acidobacteriota bacterium]
MDIIIENYLKDAIATFRNYKLMAERALEQISDDEFFEQLDAEDNSIAIIVKHISGNMRSRWTNFLDSDGEKPDRDRDGEFLVSDASRASLMNYWDTSWAILFDAIEPLTPKDFEKTVAIRGERHTIAEAINRQMTHYAYHVGQITFLAKHFRSEKWKSLSIPKNRSAEFNEFLAARMETGSGKRHPLETPMEFASIDKE